METDLLWGYEGLTDYLGPMLAARSGLWTDRNITNTWQALRPRWDRDGPDARGGRCWIRRSANQA
jgi:predicted metalloprotease with PDZ domain